MGPDLLSMAPRPACAVSLPSPLTEKHDVPRTEEEEKVKPQGPAVKSCLFHEANHQQCLWAAGLTQAIASDDDKTRLEPGSTLKTSLEAPVSVSPEERAGRLESEVLLGPLVRPAP